MKTFDFEEMVDRRGSLSVKWNRDAITNICGNPDAEAFWVADMDFPAPPAVLAAAHELSDHGVYGYPVAIDQRTIFCTWAKNRHNLDLEPSQVVISQGVLTSLSTLIEVLTDEGDGVIVGLPAYQPFMRIVNNYRRTLLNWPMKYDEESRRFSLDWERLEELLPNAKALIFCSPHNPTGMVFSADELISLCSLAAKHQVTIISDEIHADLAFTPHHCLLDAAKVTGCRAVVLMAPSKTFNIAGEHYSVTLFGDRELQNLFIKRREQLSALSPSITAITLARAAYQQGGPWLDSVIEMLKDRVNLVERHLFEHAPSLRFITPHASFIGLIDCKRILYFVEQDAALHPDIYDSALSPQGGLLSRFFGQRASVAMNDGTWFGGEEYRRFVRLNYAAPTDKLTAALDRMASAVQEARKRYSN